MTDDDDRPDHVGTDAGETPFDHRCPCSVCRDWRNETIQAVGNDDLTGLTDVQYDKALDYWDDLTDDQTALSSF
jgi:hypothetical protein